MAADETTVILDLGNESLPSEGTQKMPAELDIPSGAGQLLMTETVGNIQANNRDGRNLGTIAIGSLQAGVAKTHNELGVEESRAVSGVLATPLATPTDK